MKVTNNELAEFYKIDITTISSYRNSKDVRLANRYRAFKAFYIKHVVNGHFTELQNVSNALLNCVQAIDELDASQLQSSSN